MSQTFMCQVLDHQNEEITGLCLGVCKYNYWICTRCLAEIHWDHHQDFVSFQQLIKKLKAISITLNKKLDDLNQQLLEFIMKFEKIRKEITQKIQFFDESVEKLESEQYQHPQIKRMIELLLKQREIRHGNLAITKLQLKISQNRYYFLENIKSQLQMIASDLLKNRYYKQAKRYLKFILELDDSNFKAQIDLGICLIQYHKYSAAIDCFNKAFVIDQNNYLSFYLKGIALTKQKLYESALDCLKVAQEKFQLQFRQKNENIDSQINIVLINRDPDEKALDHTDVSYNNYRNSQEGQVEKIKILSKKQLFTDALMCCNSLVDEFSDNILGYFYRGCILTTQFKDIQAVKDLEKVISLEKKQQRLKDEQQFVSQVFLSEKYYTE